MDKKKSWEFYFKKIGKKSYVNYFKRISDKYGGD